MDAAFSGGSNFSSVERRISTSYIRIESLGRKQPQHGSVPAEMQDSVVKMRHRLRQHQQNSRQFAVDTGQ
jgi:hypothetical protein